MMADRTTIEWTRGEDGTPGATWNPITGCSIVDAGCTNCYAMALAGTRLRNHPSRAGLTRVSGGRAKWTGEVRLNEQWLDQPLRWKRPRMIFVCAHGDLFHESVPDEWIDRVFAVMALARQHTFQVLTKRPERMRKYFESRRAGDPWAEAADWIADLLGVVDHPVVVEPRDIPLPNVWLGTSVSDQASANERIPHLLATPAAVQFLSCEPLLGPLTINPRALALIDWIICGGESGPNARPMHPDWARSLRDQCVAAGVAFHFKQWGEWLPITASEHPIHYAAMNGKVVSRTFKADGQQFVKVGKKRAGRSLDGRTWDELPGVAA